MKRNLIINMIIFLLGLLFAAVLQQIWERNVLVPETSANLNPTETLTTDIKEKQNVYPAITAGVLPEPVPAGLLMNTSAFCPCQKCCGKYADNITASGHKIKEGDKFVAADKRYEFGTMMTIPGYGTVPVLDRGGAIKQNKLDVFFATHKEALQWGRQHLQVVIHETDSRPSK